MASIMHYVKSVPSHLPYGTAHRGLTGVLVDKGERYGAHAVFSFSKTYYGEKFIWKGHGADLWLGVGSLALATVLSLMSNGRSHAAEHLERIGDAGVMSAIGSLAAAYGLEKGGAKVAVHKVKGIGSDVVGAIAAAKPGPYLDMATVANYARRR